MARSVLDEPEAETLDALRAQVAAIRALPTAGDDADSSVFAYRYSFALPHGVAPDAFWETLQLKAAQAAVATRGLHLRLLASPWSPPAWMKLPGPTGQRLMTGSAAPNGLDPKMQRPWADYFSKWLSAYKEHGVHFWGVTVQNEVCGWGVDYDHLYICKLLQKTSDDS